MSPKTLSAVPKETDVDRVDIERAESTIASKRIGDRIRQLRLKRSMALTDLGTRAGLSASFLSQLETGRVVPTIRNLARIAGVFGKDISYFFHENNPLGFRVLRQGDRVRVQAGEKDSRSILAESLSSLIPDRHIVPCIAEFLLSDREDTFHPKIFEGLEFCYVIEGELLITSESEHELLEKGDVLWIDGSRRREYRCPPNKNARAMLLTRPNT